MVILLTYIFQAGIDYLRYLEQCVTDLQAQNNSPRPPPPPSRTPADEDLDSDDEMAEAVVEPEPQPQHQPHQQPHHNQQPHPSVPTYEPPPAPLQKTSSLISLPSLSQITTTASTNTTSPSVFSTRHYSVSSASQASYSPYIHSNQASPAFGPQLSHIPQYAPAPLGSPALPPLDRQSEKDAERSRAATPRQGARSELELDQEATAALLMLNSDRRVWRGREGRGGSGAGEERRGSGVPGGMSVRDLLSG